MGFLKSVVKIGLKIRYNMVGYKANGRPCKGLFYKTHSQKLYLTQLI